MISVLCFLFNLIDIYTLPSLNFDIMAILTLHLGKFTISGIGVAFRLILKSIASIQVCLAIPLHFRNECLPYY